MFFFPETVGKFIIPSDEAITLTGQKGADTSRETSGTAGAAIVSVDIMTMPTTPFVSMLV